MKKYPCSGPSVIVAFAVLLARAVCAEVVFWNQPAFGTFDFASSWTDDAKPGTNDFAVFGGTRTTVNAGVKVLFLTPQSVDAAWVAAGEYEFGFGNPGARFSLWSLVVGGSDSEYRGEFASVPADLPASAVLTMRIPAFTFPGTVETRNLEIGPPPFADETIRAGTLRIEGSGSLWLNTGDPGDFEEGRLFVGGFGNEGTLIVASGAHLENQKDVFIGGGNSRPWNKPAPEMGTGNLLVEGFGSEFLAEWVSVASSFLAATTSYPGYSSRGTVSVEDEALLRTGALALGSHEKDLLPRSDDPAAVTLTQRGKLRVDSTLYLSDSQTSVSVTTNASAAPDPFGGAAVVGLWPEPIHFIPGTIQVIGGGSIEGGGCLRGDLAINGGQILATTYHWVRLGDAWERSSTPRCLKIDGSLSEEPGSWIRLRVAGYGTNDQSTVEVTGTTLLAGNIGVEFAKGFVPVVGDTFQVFCPGGSFNFSNATIHASSETSGFNINAVLTVTGALQITKVVRPAQLNISLSNGEAGITWNTNGRLQSGPTPAGPWQYITNAPNPLRIPATGNCFFRVVD